MRDDTLLRAGLTMVAPLALLIVLAVAWQAGAARARWAEIARIGDRYDDIPLPDFEWLRAGPVRGCGRAGAWLAWILYHKPLRAWELREALLVQSSGTYDLSLAGLYDELTRLLDLGLAEMRETDAEGRRLYRLTEGGRRLLAAVAMGEGRP